MVIVTTTPRNRLTFIRDYCETCGCIEIHRLETYVTQKVFDKLKLNIALSAEELKTAAYHSVGKGAEYWEGLCHKGSGHLFDIGNEILPFLANPVIFCAAQDQIVSKSFLEKINIWLGRNPIDQPPETLAQEVADKILGTLLAGEPEQKYLEVYKKWIDSKAHEESLKSYCNQVQAQYQVAEPWGVHPMHPFSSMDEIWIVDLAKHLSDTKYIEAKISRLHARWKTGKGRQWRNGLWARVLQLLEFDTSKIKTIATLEEATAYYTNELYRIDTAIRVIYEAFWGDDDLIRPFQEYYNQLMSPFLFKWFQYFGDYQENQKGLLIDKIQSAKARIAIVVGDGISYEIARNVIAKVGIGIQVQSEYRCCGIPSITENNMSLLYRDDGVVETVQAKREAYLKGMVKKSIDFVQLDEINYLHTDVELLICSYKDIDDIAEKLGHKALKFIGTIEDTLVEKIQFLLKSGFGEVLLTSDHGFVLTGILDESDKVEVKFQGEVSKAERYIRTVEKQAASHDLIEYKQRFENYQYLYFTRNMKPFKTPGKYGYAHGGLAPQELIIPFISFSSHSAAIQELQITVANQSQLSGVVGNYFSIQLKAAEGNGELFSQERKVQLLFIEQGKEYNKSDIVTLKAGEMIKKEFSFDGHYNIDVIVVDASSKQTLTKVSVVQIIARDLGGL